MGLPLRELNDVYAEEPTQPVMVSQQPLRDVGDRCPCGYHGNPQWACTSSAATSSPSSHALGRPSAESESSDGHGV